jgi:ComEC/Rec2-related protein
MDEARDIVGTSVPFVAGVAMGAFLCPVISGKLLLPAFLIPIILTTLITAGFFTGQSPDSFRKIIFPAAFLMSGLMCSINSFLSEGISIMEGNPISTTAEKAVSYLRATIDSIPYRSDTTGPLVKALLTGDRSGLTKDITRIFRDSGASHLLALSGLHLGVIYLILTRMAAPLGNGRRARVLKYSLIVGAAAFYSIMTGAAPSIVRALLFIILNETAKLLGRKREPARVLFTALTVQLALKPGVITSVGFQLSYLAMAGIFFLFPTLDRIYPSPAGGGRPGFDPFRKIWSAAVLSISCQVFTGPLAWYYFHSFPEYFILTNLIALPLTSAIMTLSVATIALTCLGICPEFLVTLNDGAMQALVFSLEIISSL